MFRIHRNAVLVEDFQFPKTYRLRFELFLNSTQTFFQGRREIFTISDGRIFADSHIIPLQLLLNTPEHQNKSGLFEIRSENWFGQIYPGTNSIYPNLFNQVAIKPDHWPSSKKRENILTNELSVS